MNMRFWIHLSCFINWKNPRCNCLTTTAPYAQAFVNLHSKINLTCFCFELLGFFLLCTLICSRVIVFPEFLFILLPPVFILFKFCGSESNSSTISLCCLFFEITCSLFWSSLKLSTTSCFSFSSSINDPVEQTAHVDGHAAAHTDDAHGEEEHSGGHGGMEPLLFVIVSWKNG